MANHEQNLRSHIRHEVEPIIVHGIAVLILEAFLILVGVGLLTLKRLFPDHASRFDFVEGVDISLVIALVCMFGVYTLVIIGIRLAKGIAREWR